MRRLLICSLLATLTLAAQTLQVTRGAAPYQVYQRGSNNSATLNVEGNAANAAGRAVEIRVLRSGNPTPVIDWKPAGKVTGATFTAAIEAVPTGGPYRLELRAGANAPVTGIDNLLVGDLWILAGQSNMEGVGNLENLPLPSAFVNSFDMTDTWVSAEDPLHRLADTKDSFHWRRNSDKTKPLSGLELQKWIANRKKGAGVGLPFALEMVRRTGVPIGLVPCAHGGTSMDQWSPSLKGEGGASLYGGMLRRFKEAGGRVAGVLWYQGESDASPKAAPLFEQKFTDLIKAIRADFNQPSLPFYYVQIGRHVNAANIDEWHAVQDLQRKVETALPNLGMTTAIDLDMDDGIHVGTDSFLVLAARMANLAEGKLKRGPRPASAEVKGSVITVTFNDVNGGLAHTGRLNGFTIHNAEGKPVPMIFRQRISKTNPNAVELLFGGKLPEGATLHYGYGKDPYLNLVDQANMPLPVFGPLPIQQ